jgi:hypothetical protein
MSDLTWTSAGPTGQRFLDAARAAPGWYWILRPHQDGPGRYDPATPVASLVHVFADDRISSPLADLRALDPEQLAPLDGRGRRFPSLFAGPVRPGASEGTIRVTRRADPPEVEGELPATPGWYWCRTNEEAPLLHVDADGIGPIYVDRLDGAIHVWSAATLDGRPVDVGELGFSEPLVSPGGIIDASGELGRVAVELFGAIALPPLPAEPLWPTAPPPAEPELRLADGETVLRVADLPRARAFYEKLGFRVTAARPEEGWATLEGGDLRLRLVTGRGAALRFAAAPGAQAALEAMGLTPEPGPEGLVVVDPDGHRLVIAS